jgi:hypothetical protein
MIGEFQANRLNYNVHRISSPTLLHTYRSKWNINIYVLVKDPTNTIRRKEILPRQSKRIIVVIINKVTIIIKVL